MDEALAFRRASDGFARLVGQVTASQWSAATPCADWDIRALVNHVAGEYLWVPELMAGRTVADVGSKLDGDLLHGDPRAAVVAAARAAQASTDEADAMTRIVHLSFGDVSGAAYLKQMAVDSVIHSWDLARAIGADETLDPELVDFSYEELRQTAEDWRSGGAFGPATEAGDDSKQSKLLALTGR